MNTYPLCSDNSYIAKSPQSLCHVFVQDPRSTTYPSLEPLVGPQALRLHAPIVHNFGLKVLFLYGLLVRRKQKL